MPDTRALPPHWAAALLLALAFGLRAADFGSPIIAVDEQYYLLVGQRMLDGALPYVDIWDRRPVGLFLIYAAAAALPGDDLWGYQSLAALFAGLTAIAVSSGARTIGASRAGAFAAGVAYLIWLPLLGGRGGQAPVFANLFTAGAALLALRLPMRTDAGRSIVRDGALAALLAGVATQIRSTAAIEAGFVIVAYSWGLHLSGARPSRLVGAVLLWIGAACVPTLAAMLFYRAAGPSAFDAWWFATIVSRASSSDTPGEMAVRLIGIVALLSPLLLGAAIAWRRRRVRLVDERAIAFGWLVAALAGFASSGAVLDHHALPLVAPLAVVAGLALGRITRILVGTLLLGFLLLVAHRVFIPHDAAGARTVAAVVQANSRGACPYVFAGDAATYTLAHACLPTSRARPAFLSSSVEAGSIGLDAVAEVRRIVAARPPVIVAATRRQVDWNAATLAVVKPALARGYRPVFSVPRANYRTVVFLRNDLPFIAR